MNSYPHKYDYFRILVQDTSDSSDTTTGALVVRGGIGVQGSLSIGGTLRTSGSWTNTSTTVSVSSTTGALVLTGGLGISSTTDATSFTNGGSFTTAGGVAIAKRLFVGDVAIATEALISATASGSTDGGSVVLAYASTPGISSATDSSTWSLGVTSGNALVVRNINASALVRDVISISETTGEISVKSKQSTTLVSFQPNREDQLSERTFTSSTDVVGSATDITGLVFNTSRAFSCNLVVFIDATVPVSAMYKLYGVKKGDGTWQLAVQGLLVDNVPVTFSITSGGQVRYTKTTTAGHVSTTMKWRLETTYD